MPGILELVNRETQKIDEEGTTQLQQDMYRLQERYGVDYPPVRDYRKLKEGASETVRSIVVIPPRTTGVGRGFPTFRAGSSIIYRCSLNLVHLSAERETTSRPTVDRCGGIAATDRNFCLFRDTRSLTDSGSY